MRGSALAVVMMLIGTIAFLGYCFDTVVNPDGEPSNLWVTGLVLSVITIAIGVFVFDKKESDHED